MLFLTYWFVIFAAFALGLYWVVPHAGGRRLILLSACAVFHWHFAGPAGVFPIVVLGVVTWFAGGSRNPKACLAGIWLCVLALLFYKYTTFLCQEVLGALWPSVSSAALDAAQHVLPLAPPLGISFFVFEFVHYLYDVRKGREPIRNPVDFGIFAIFWPSIVAGPIKRFEQFVPVLHHGTGNVCEQDVAEGLIRVAAGLVKKFVADNLAAYLAFWAPRFADIPLGQRWWIFVAIGLRILLDFSGYSDMAIGFARMMGIRLPENFNWPYVARNISDFWHRWHISLSSWIRDYIYIPLGGGRRGVVRRMVNGIIAFGLCGLWHGAAWNFLVWGLYHGLGLVIHANYRAVVGRFGQRSFDALGRTKIVPWACTMIFVHVGWLFFFYPVPQACKMLKLLFDFST